MEVLVHWFTDNLSQHISREMVIFIISMIPILELRGGLLAASLLKVSAAKAIPICIIGNIIPIPFILLFILTTSCQHKKCHSKYPDQSPYLFHVIRLHFCCISI